MKIPAGDDRVVRLADGRRITYRTYGAPCGHPVLALHGTPGSRLKFASTEQAAAALGLSVIAPDRWGYGGTDPHTSPSLAAFAADIGVLADRLGMVRFAVMGVSGGGPYAAALAALLPDRITAIAMVSPVGPIAGESDPEIGAFHRFCFGPLARRPRAIRGVFTGFRWLLNASPRLGLGIAMARVPPADRATLAADGVSDRLARTFIEGLRQGTHGPTIDLGLFGRDWNVPLERARAAAKIWIGSEDRNVPISATRRLAARMSGCTLTVIPDEGHLWVALHYDEILEWLAEKAKGASLPAPSNDHQEP